MKPTNRIPVVGDMFTNEWDSTGPRPIREVGQEIVEGDHIGRAIVCDDGGYDCFWSDENQRFQYFPDGSVDV